MREEVESRGHSAETGAVSRDHVVDFQNLQLDAEDCGVFGPSQHSAARFELGEERREKDLWRSR